MKIIGLMMTWNNIEFFRYSVKQALNFCDELILVEGCHSMKYPKHSTDGTCEYIETIKESPKLVIRDFERGDRYDRVQLRIRQNFPKESALYRPGNWIIHWDDDIFFFDRDLVRLRTAMETMKQDALVIEARLFIYNFKFNWFWPFIVCYRIVDGLRLTGISTYCYSSGKKFKKKRIEGAELFHYNHVRKPERFKARMVMSVEKGTKTSVGRFEKWMSITWKKEEDIFKYKNDLEFIGEQLYGFNIYIGAHPEILNNHPWRHIDDIRNLE